MKLLETYALGCGLAIDKPSIVEKFYPLNENRYITLQAGSGQQTKNYDYFNEVMDLLLPFFRANKINVIQLGGKEEPPIKHCQHLMGQTTLGQAANLIRGALLHLGCDSWMAHYAGSINRPFVSLYGSTSEREHGPYWSANATMIEAHRNGRKPSFSAEWPKTVNTIKPEEIANAVLHRAGLIERVSQNTIFVGQAYNQTILEYTPNFMLDPRLAAGQPITVRFDYGGDENILAQGLAAGRKFNIVTNRSLNLDLLNQFKGNIVGLTVELNDIEPNYIRAINRLGLKARFISREKDEQKIADLRMKMFDYCRVEFVGAATKENFFTETDLYLNSTLDRETKLDSLNYRSNKFLLSSNKIFASKAAWLADKAIPSFEENTQTVMDSPEFWEEFQHFRIFQIV